MATAYELTSYICYRIAMLSLPTPWRHIRRVEVYIQSFLTSALDGGELSTSRPRPLYHRIRNWGAGWAPEPVWTFFGEESANLYKHKVRSFLQVNCVQNFGQRIRDVRKEIPNFRSDKYHCCFVVYCYNFTECLRVPEKLSDLYSLPPIVRVVKSRRMRWAGHVARMEEGRGVHRVLMRKPEGKRPLGRPQT